jgi:hypothetical protein
MASPKIGQKPLENNSRVLNIVPCLCRSFVWAVSGPYSPTPSYVPLVQETAVFLIKTLRAGYAGHGEHSRIFHRTLDINTVIGTKQEERIQSTITLQD